MAAASERSPLLGHNDRQTSPSARSVSSDSGSDTLVDLGEQAATSVQLGWVLTGLWSAVFLGALDGTW
jgi:hypothetical protein